MGTSALVEKEAARPTAALAEGEIGRLGGSGCMVSAMLLVLIAARVARLEGGRATAARACGWLFITMLSTDVLKFLVYSVRWAAHACIVRSRCPPLESRSSLPSVNSNDCSVGFSRCA